MTIYGSWFILFVLSSPLKIQIIHKQHFSKYKPGSLKKMEEQNANQKLQRKICFNITFYDL